MLFHCLFNLYLLMLRRLWITFQSKFGRIWNYNDVMKCKLFVITVVPIDNDLRILYLKHHQSASDGWTIHSLCYVCRSGYKNNINFINN